MNEAQLSKDKTTQLIKYWQKGSEEDLKTALDIFSCTERNTACLFFLHLAIEKALKAKYVFYFQAHAPYTHNLLHLLSKLGWSVEEEKIALLAEVNDFNMEARYPDDKRLFFEKATRDFTAEYVTKCCELLEWISQK